MGCIYLFHVVLSSSLDKYLEMELLNNMVVLFHTVFYSLYSHQQCIMVSFSSHPKQHWLFLVFLIIVILM